MKLLHFVLESTYKDHRRPDEVYFIRSLNEDLNRRDFTMNAIAMDKDGQLIDPFFGRRAIEQQRIETVGRAQERFSEDALRMMRAVRFVSQLSFTLDKACEEALVKMGHLLELIAVERKTAEFEKLLAGKNRLKALELLCKLNLDQYLPGLKNETTKISSVSQYPCDDLGVDEMWGLLLYCLQINPKDVDFFLRNWKLPVKRIRIIKEIVQWVNYRFHEKWNPTSMYDAGFQMVNHSERVYMVINHQEIGQSINQLQKQYRVAPD